MQAVRWIAGGLATATLTVGFAGGSWGAEAGARAAATTADRCAKAPQLADWIDAASAALGARRATLLSWRDEAETAGRSRAVTRIDALIERIDARAAKLAERETTLTTWVEANCAPA